MKNKRQKQKQKRERNTKQISYHCRQMSETPDLDKTAFTNKQHKHEFISHNFIFEKTLSKQIV